MSENETELKNRLEEANDKYRNGEETGLTDVEYDELLEQVIDEDYKSKVGVKIQVDKVELPRSMGSMEKIKTHDKLIEWHNSIGGAVTCTPKFDGIALLVEYGMNGKFVRAMTRGDGVHGQDVTEHFKSNKLSHINSGFKERTLVVGEAIMPKETFYAKYKNEFKNPRNMVAGLLSRKDTHHAIKDVSFMVFDVINSETEKLSKNYRMSICNDNFNKKINKCIVPSITTSTVDSELFEKLDAMRVEYSDYEIDGIIIDIADNDMRKNLGNETNSLNPKFARAYKPAVEETRNVEVLDIIWATSKSGKLAPVLSVTPTELDGVTISNVTAYNAKYLIDNGIRIGSVVTIIRSGAVIPKVVGVVSTGVAKMGLPTECPTCDHTLRFSKSSVDLMCVNEECGAQNYKKIVSFFETLGVENCKEGTINTLVEHGFASVKAISEMTLSDFDGIAGFGNSRATKIMTAIKEKFDTGVSLQILQDASNLFTNLGSRKLELLNEFNTRDNIPTYDHIVSVDGFSDISANVYLENIESFWDFADSLDVKILTETKEPASNELEGKVFVFSGFRNKDLEADIADLGGKMGSSVSSKTTHLVVKDKTATTSKITKAQTLGINIWDQADLDESMSVWKA
jgi:NAD-dependent DNA ligase